MAERRKLGRGLSTLIPTERTAAPEETTPEKPAAKPAGRTAPDITSELPASALRDVPTSAIEPNPNQPRVHFDEDSLSDLAKSIKEIGVLQPLLVREVSPGKYQLIAGERRWRAAQKAKLSEVPVVVREISELDSVEQALVENLHRQDLTALEEASAYQQLTDDFSLTHEQVAKRVGKSRAAITNALRLLQTPAAVQGFLADGRLSAGHARALLGCDNAATMESLAELAVSQGWSVRATEDAVKNGVPGHEKPKGKGGSGGGTTLRPAGLLELENLLAEHLETKVHVTMGDKRGKISIDFADLLDLERIYRRMAE
jgi:ParB family chromosome partitioning protein